MDKDDEGQDIPTTPKAFAEYKMRKLSNEQFLDEFKKDQIPVPDDLWNFAFKFLVKLILGVLDKRNRLKDRIEAVELKNEGLEKRLKDLENKHE